MATPNPKSLPDNIKKCDDCDKMKDFHQRVKTQTKKKMVCQACSANYRIRKAAAAAAAALVEEEAAALPPIKRKMSQKEEKEEVEAGPIRKSARLAAMHKGRL